jgi:hypothetical protein
MSIVQKLTEGIVNRDMAKEGAALLDKWSSTGLLEGLQTDQAKSNMARLLENQAKELLREASSMGAGDVEGFAAVAFPIVRRVFAGLIANDLVSVQPMSLPSGLIFFLDFVYSPNLGEGSDVTSRLGNSANASIYGTNRVGMEVTGGVSLVDSTSGADLSGPGRGGSTGYAYGSPTGSLASAVEFDANAQSAGAFIITLDGNLTETEKKLLQFDPDLLAKDDSSMAIVGLDIAESKFTNPDFNNLSAFEFPDITTAGNGTLHEMLHSADGEITSLAQADLSLIRRLTKRVSTTTAVPHGAQTSVDAVRFYIGINIGSGNSAVLDRTTVFQGDGDTANDDLAVANLKYPQQDAIGGIAAIPGALRASALPLEGNESIPEIDIKVDSIAITAQTKKLKAKWTPELGQDLNAYHNLDAEVELTSILSEQIALEIDREILADLVNGATAATYYWSRSPGLFVNRETGAELGATAAAPDFTGTVSEWYETLIETINDVSAQIHRKTLRGGANYVVCSPEVANILEFTAGFRANVTADADRGDIGAVNVGSLSRKFDVIVDPYFPRNVILVGRKGNSFLESGYVYAPYVPLQTTPTIFGPEDFVPRKGVMTRYAKKMVRPDMYGLVICRGLLGESGAS